MFATTQSTALDVTAALSRGGLNSCFLCQHSHVNQQHSSQAALGDRGHARGLHALIAAFTIKDTECPLENGKLFL